METYIAQLERLSDHATGSIKKAVYDGAAVVADSIKASLHTIPVQEEFVPKGKKRNGITQVQKDGLISGFGLAKMRNSRGYVNTKAGFSGKNADGEKNSMIARQVESGTSWLSKHPVIRQAANKSKGAAEQAIQKTLESEIRKIMN